MDDISTLQIRVKSGEVSEATIRLNLLTQTAGKAEKATGGLTKQVLGMASGFLSAGLAAKGLMEILGNSRSYQVMMANMKTATGSVENAEKAFNRLLVIARETPFSLAQVNDAFIKLVNYGLTPSERAIRSYGNTAAATSKDVVQLVEGVADAVNGEFERVKEAFNVKAKNMGDTVVFRFRGATTEVKNNAKEIEEYFIRLGEVNFAGAMEERMKTLDGAIANLGDSWDQLMVKLGESGLADVAEELIRDLTDALEGLTGYIESGAMNSALESWGAGWGDIWKDIREGADITGDALANFVNEAQEMLTGHKDEVKSVADEGWGSVIDFIQRVPASIQAMTVLVVAELRKIKSQIDATFTVPFENLMEQKGADFNQWWADNTGDKGAPRVPGKFQTGSSLWDEKNIDLRLPSTIGSAADATNFTNSANARDRQNLADAFAEATAQEVLQSWDETATKFNETLMEQDIARANSKAKYDRYLYNEEHPLLGPKPGGDELEPFGVGVDESSNSTKKAGGKGKGGSKVDKARREFDQLKKLLTDEETAYQESYTKRLQIIDKFTDDGSVAEMTMSLAALDEWEEQSLRYAEKLQKDQDTMWEGLQLEERLLKESYERRKEIILAATATTEEQKAALLAEAQSEYFDKIKKHTAETNELYLGAAKDFFGDLASIGSAFGEKGFKIAKSAAIAQATIKMYESATGAYSAMAGIPYVGPTLGAIAAGAAIAAGMANIAQIKSQTFSAGGGSFEMGGIVPGNSWSGDQMGIRANSGEMVLTRPQQNNLFRMANGSSSPNKAPNVTIINNAGVNVRTATTEDSNGFNLQFFLEAAERHMTESVDKGGTPFSRMMERRYPLVRGNRVSN